MEEEVFDAHVHLYPDAIAERVTASLGGKFGNPPAFTASVAGCRAHAARAGVAWSLNLPVATAPEQVDAINRWAAAVNAAALALDAPAGPRVLSLAALHPHCDDLGAQVEAIAEAGFAGIKFHPEYQHFAFDARHMDACWEAMSARGLVAYLHAGGERVFTPPFHSRPTDVVRLHRRFPGLRIVAAHLGGWRMWDEAEAVLCGLDVTLDLSHIFGWCDTAQALRIIRLHGAERILFGTDAPWQDPANVLRAFNALPLAAEERHAILSANARRLFRVPAGL